MRELQTSDLFAFVRLIEKSGIKDELKAKALEIKSIADINAESLGYDIILMMLEKAAEPKTEKEVYAFFAPIFEMKEEEIKKMIIERDHNDMNREHSPLRRADDAISLDSTGMTIEEVQQAILNIVAERVEK